MTRLIGQPHDLWIKGFSVTMQSLFLAMVRFSDWAQEKMPLTLTNEFFFLLSKPVSRVCQAKMVDHRRCTVLNFRNLEILVKAYV
jgi:hypothetical protein